MSPYRHTMPTPYGSRGGMAFGAGELRVLRRALALALHPGSATVQDVQDCHRLAESVDDAVREHARFRTFLLADLARYRTALPGTAGGYLKLLSEVLDTGYRPEPADLKALRALPRSRAVAALLDRCRAAVAAEIAPVGRTPGTDDRVIRPAGRAPLPAARAARPPGALSGTGYAPCDLPRHTAQEPAEEPCVPTHGDVAGSGGRVGARSAPAPRSAAPSVPTVVPPSRRRLLALPGGLAPAAPTAAGTSDAPEPDGPAEPSRSPETESAPEREQESEPQEAPERGGSPQQEPAPEPEEQEPDRKRGRPSEPRPPGRPVPTPAEVFPPKRKPAPPGDTSSAASPLTELAAG